MIKRIIYITAEILIAVPLFFLCFISISFSEVLSAQSIRMMFAMLLLAASVRVSDDIFDYKKDCAAGKNILPFPALIVLFTFCVLGASGLSFDRLWPLCLIFGVWVVSCGVIERVLTMRFSAAIKITVLPVLYAFVLLQISDFTGKQFGIFSYIILCAVAVTSVLFCIRAVKKNRPRKIPDIGLVGGKAYNLLRIAGVRCPRFIVLDSEFLKNAAASEGCAELIKSKLGKKINAKKLYAVRSSAADEDSADSSFAGIMESYLNVACTEIPDKIAACYNAVFSGRAEAYRTAKNIAGEKRSAVIVQEMLDADYAGVIFTINPVNNDPDEILISAVRGLGEKLVAGAADSSDYVLAAGGAVTAKKNEDILPKSVLKKLYKFALTIQSQCSHFQDIEFAVRNGKVYFLQTRDITNYSHIDIRSPKKILDNSNIIESYSGLTLPLTVSFAKEMYYNVYKETIRQSHVSKKLLNRLEDTFKTMLEDYNGRIYYNLNSWYKLTGIFPGTKNKTEDMERMMGVSTKLENKRVKMSLPDLLKFIVTLLSRIKNLPHDSEKYLTEFNATTFPYSFYSFEDFSEKNLVGFYNRLADDTLHFYTVPIVNDVAAMISYGKLTRRTARLGIKDKDGYISALLSHQGNLESADSIKILTEIAEKISDNESVKNDFLTLRHEQLRQRYGETIIFRLIDDYLKRFGARVPDELKLETVTMLENPAIFFEMLKKEIVLSSEKSGNGTTESPGNTEIPKGLKAPLIKTKFYIRNRERLRLTRTYIFSAARRMFLRFGSIYKDKGYISDEKDIFYLTKNEIFNAADGDSKILQILADRRKAEYEGYRNISTSNRIAKYGEEVLEISDTKLSAEDTALKGIPSGAGKITGEIKIIDDPNASDIKDKIIVAKRTDPGWITAFTLCKGLIVEKGSILSHSAVVARELGIPAVVGAAGAVSLLHDGDIVELDAVKGEITVLG